MSWDFFAGSGLGAFSSAGTIILTGPFIVHMTTSVPWSDAGAGIQPTGRARRKTIAANASQSPADFVLRNSVRVPLMSRAK